MILAIGAIEAQVEERLRVYGEVAVVDPQDPAEIARRLPDAVAIVARAVATIDAGVIDAAQRLRVIGRSGVGVDRVDVDAATRRGIPVVITPDAGARAVAEGALALMLHLVKRLGPLTRLVAERLWAERDGCPLGDLDGGTLAVIGYGRIGRRLAEIAGVLGMRVVASDPYSDAAAIDPAVTLMDLRGALEVADVISLHAPLTPATRGLIDDGALRHVKAGAVLVNCARGGLLDLDAAYAALVDGRLAGVGLDVFDPEPPDDHPLFHHPDVVLTPHVMGLSRRARAVMSKQLADGIDDVLAGRRAPHVANPAVYDRASPPT